MGSQKKNQEKAELHMSIGNAHFEKRNYPYALQELLRAEELDPRNPLIQNNLGLVYFMRQRYDLSEKHLLKALALEPKFSDARNNLGRVYIDMKRYVDSEKMLRMALADLTYAGADRAWFNLGLLQFNQKKWLDAKASFENSLSVVRDSCLTNTYLGRTLFEMKDYPSAALSLDRAVGFCQSQMYDEPHYYSALAWFRSGDTDKAKARFQEIIQLYPEGVYREKARAMIPLIEKGAK